VDLTVLLPPGQEELILAELLAAFPGRIPDALAFARRNRVLLLTVPGGANVDLSLGLPGYTVSQYRLFPPKKQHPTPMTTGQSLAQPNSL